MLDQSVTTSLRRSIELSDAFDSSDVPSAATPDSLVSLVRRFRPQIEAILNEESNRSVA